MKVGDSVVVVQQHSQDRNGASLIGRSGVITTQEVGTGLRWDVKLDAPLPDGRSSLWFSSRELQVI